MVAKLRSDELRRVLAQRKLLLILDLDHTLLNSARVQDVRARAADRRSFAVRALTRRCLVLT